MHPRYHTIAPEILFQRFYACLDEPTFTPFFDVLRDATPNPMHSVLATLSLSHRLPILTTNFDRLIERASRPSTPIVHLHGDLEKPMTMVTRIHQVGRGITRSVLGSAKTQLSGRVLCVLGYSGNDNDIWAAVQDSDPTAILWLIRNGRDVASRNLERFARRSELFVARGDLRRVAAAFRQKTKWANPDREDLLKRQQKLATWRSLPKIANRYACISELFFEIEDYRNAAAVSIEAFRYARGTKLEGWFRIQAAEALKVLGKFKDAEALAREAIRLNTKIGDPFDIAGAYNIFGLLNIEKEKPDAKRGLRALRAALKVVRKINLKSCSKHRREGIRLFTGRVLNNIGLGYWHLGNVRRAITYYRRSLSLKRRVGDLLGVAVTSGNISLANERMGRLRRGKYWRRQALSLMEKYELRFQQAYLLRETGRMACSRGERERGRRLLEAALAMYRRLHAAFGISLTKTLLKRSL